MKRSMLLLVVIMVGLGGIGLSTGTLQVRPIAPEATA